MGLKSSKTTEKNTRVLEIEVDAETFEKAIQSAYRKNVSKIAVPGFRKGKAPRKMIEKMYGEAVFYDDAINEVYPDAYEAAVAEAGIDPVSQPTLDIVSAGKEGLVFTAEVTVKPEVEISSYKGISATKYVHTVTDDEINAEVERLRERSARLVNVDDRAVQDKDSVIIDFDGSVDGVPFEGGKAEKYPLEIGSHSFIDNFEEQIIGHNIGDEFDVNVTFPENYQVEELKGKPAVFKVKVHEISVKELAELDDEFAKDVSEFDTLDALKEDVRKHLQESADHQSQDALETQLVEGVIANMKADIPEIMVENKIDELINEFEYRLSSQGLQLDTYLQYTGMDKDAFRKTYRESADKQVKIRLALEKIAEIENLAPTAEEVEAEYQKMAESYNLEAEKIKSLLPEKSVKLDLGAGKAIDLIKETAIIEEKSADSKAE